MRTLPNVPLSPVPDGYLKLLAQGWDTFKENYDVIVPEQTEAMLARLKAAAAEAVGVARDPVTIPEPPVQPGEPGQREGFQVGPTGGRGVSYIVRNPDMLLEFHNTGSVSVTYSAAGLWRHGLSRLRGRFHLWAGAYLQQKPIYGGWWINAMKVSRADYAMDFLSPAFGNEFRPEMWHALVSHSSSKRRFGKSAEDDEKHPVDLIGRTRVETMTVGSKAGLQIQVYDKGLEISEASGKTWMIELWRRGGLDAQQVERSTVYRLEIRMGREFLKDRNARDDAAMVEKLPRLLTEALFTKRLTKPLDTDSNRRRWPLHPLWTAALMAVSDGETEMEPLGHYVIGRRDVLVERAVRQLAGTIRAATVLRDSGYSGVSARELVDAAVTYAEEDGDAALKEAKLKERFKFVDDPA